MKEFDYSLDFETTDFRANPHLCRIGRGEQGVLTVQPYKSEIRARRYANYRGGKKYDGPVPADKKQQSGAHGRAQLPRQEEDPIKAESARIFKQAWDQAAAEPKYRELRLRHRKLYE